MFFHGKEQDYQIVIKKTIVKQNYNIILLDWFNMYKETREAILEYAISEADKRPKASSKCTAAVIIPRNDGKLDFNNCRLHISTIGRIDPSDISGFINKYMGGNANRLENLVTLSGCEKVMILCMMLPSLDMRGVV